MSGKNTQHKRKLRLGHNRNEHGRSEELKKKISVTGAQARAERNGAERTGGDQVREHLIWKECECQPDGNRKPKRTFQQQTERSRFYLGKNRPEEEMGIKGGRLMANLSLYILFSSQFFRLQTPGSTLSLLESRMLYL